MGIDSASRADAGAVFSESPLEVLWVGAAAPSSPLSSSPFSSLVGGGGVGVCGGSEDKEVEVVDREGEGTGWGVLAGVLSEDSTVEDCSCVPDE